MLTFNKLLDFYIGLRSTSGIDGILNPKQPTEPVEGTAGNYNVPCSLLCLIKIK